MANTDINASGSGDINALTSSNAQYGLGSGLPTAAPVQSTVSPQAANAASAPLASSAPASTSSQVGATPGSVPALIPNWDQAATNPAQYSADAAGGVSGTPTSGTTTLAGGTGAPASAATSDSGGFDWNSILSGLGGILSSPLAGAAGVIALGEYEASQAESQTANLTKQLTGPATPYVQAGTTELQQTMQGLTGQPVTSGSIGQQETAAAELGQVAEQYGTGQLTTAQQLQVQQQTAAEKQAVATQLAAAGVTDSAVLDAYNTQADNNAAILTKQLTDSNLATAQTALASVQNTYNTLLTQSTQTFAAGMGPIEDAVNITIQQDTAIANGLQQLFSSVAKAFTSAGGAGGGGLGGAIGSLGSAIGKALGLTTAASTAVAGAPPSAAAIATSNDIAASTGIGDISSFGADGSAAAANWGGVAADANAGGIGASSVQVPGLAESTTPWGGIAADANAAAPTADAAATAPAAADATATDAVGGVGGGGAGDAAGAAGASPLSMGAGALGAAAGAYELATGWQSGRSGFDAMAGAETGAGIGTMILPGIGTLVGGLIGGAAGAVSSLFGPGRSDPETGDVQNVINAVSSNGNNPGIAAAAPNPYVMMAGLFDERSSTLPIYQKYGRMGEAAFTNDMVKQINSAMQSGKITPATSAEDVYNQVVAPWMQSMGNWSNVGPSYMATVQGLSYQMVNQYMSGSAATDWKAVGGDSPFGNIYAGSMITPTALPGNNAGGGPSDPTRQARV